MLLLFVGIIIGGSFYILNYSLASAPDRMDTDSCYIRLFENYPETEEWVDSLREANALRDTFMTFPEGYRCHAYYVKKINRNRDCGRTALLIHGWRDQAIKFFYLARMYEREFGYNVVIPDVYGHGQSDGDVVRMGWLDRLDMLRWLEAFKTDNLVLDKVSEPVILNRWLRPSTFRRIHFSSSYQDIDYII